MVIKPAFYIFQHNRRSLPCAKGVNCQERHLFLFNDLLLVAKAKSGSNFKLKDKVRVSEMWLNESPSVIDEVAEVPKSSDTSFVIGWPTTNYVAVFRLVLEEHPSPAVRL